MRKKKMRQKFGSATAITLLTVLAGHASEATKSPNVVFLFADQMRAQAMGCMGNKEVITPHLDQLASEGILITNGISAQPVCTPYRGHLMTGRYGHSTGVIHNEVRLPDNEIVISELMKDAGYSTGYIGKWHLMGSRSNPVDAVNRRGWDFWAVKNCSHKHFNPEYWLNDSKEPIEVPDAWEPDVQTDLAVDFIQQNKENPFCLFVSYGPPHNPYKAPAKYQKMYEGKEITFRPNVPDSAKKRSLNGIREYYAMVTSLDDCVARITTALKKADVAENTILVFTSDHGDMIGSQSESSKQRPWEESIHIPFIIRYPEKIKAGQRKDWIVSSVDVMPTLLGLCDIAVPENVQGFNYADTFIGKSDKERDAAFLFNIGIVGGSARQPLDWRGIRTKEWTYAYNKEGDWVMYDLKNDPYQLRNLVNNPEYSKKKQMLKQQVERMRSDLGESIPLDWVNPFELPGQRRKRLQEEKKRKEMEERVN